MTDVMWTNVACVLRLEPIIGHWPIYWAVHTFVKVWQIWSYLLQVTIVPTWVEDFLSKNIELDQADVEPLGHWAHQKMYWNAFLWINLVHKRILQSGQAVVKQPLSSHWAVVKQSSSSHQAVIKKLSSSHWAVIEQSLSSHWAVVEQSSSSRQAVIEQ